MCGLESPGLCEEFLNTDTPQVVTAVVTTDAVIVVKASMLIVILILPLLQ